MGGIQFRHPKLSKLHSIKVLKRSSIEELAGVPVGHGCLPEEKELGAMAGFRGWKIAGGLWASQAPHLNEMLSVAMVLKHLAVEAPPRFALCRIATGVWR